MSTESRVLGKVQARVAGGGYSRALAGREKSLGKEHPRTISTASRLSSIKDQAKTGRPLFSLVGIAADMVTSVIQSIRSFIFVICSWKSDLQLLTVET